ncbi:MAG TPA: MDR family MFS transporter [Aliidongia sp.]|nr:MDR family MFS transporter [Aliidongia sp.]
MSAALAPSPAGGGHRAITVAALLAIYMQAVNISLPNAALPHMQGTLSMANDEVGWVFTAYIAASIITMPLTRWLAGRYGRKAVYQVATAAFALGLVLDTLATTPIQFVLARIVQGAAGGPLGPLSLAILLDVLPPARHARINLVGAVTGLFGISTGASIGGWLSEYHGWHSIFYFSLPMTGLIFLVMALSLSEKKPAQNPPFDFFGWATFALGLTGLQMLLDRGERLEWFASAEIWAEALASALGFYLFIVHVLTTKVHFLNKALLRDRNFVFSTIMCFGLGFVLLPTLALTSPMLEELLGYPVDTTGYMTLPRGVGLVGALVLMGFVPSRIDSRPFVLGGMALVAYANWRMLGYSPAMDWRAVATAGLFQGVGLGIAIPALTKAAFGTLDPKFRPEGTALFNLSRLYGSTIGIAVVQIFFYDNTQAMHLALAKNLTPYRAAAHVAGSLSRQGLAALNETITGQGAVIAIIDQFKILMVVMLIVSPLVLLLRKPRPINQPSRSSP